MAKKRQPTNREILSSFDDKTRETALRLRSDPILFCKHVLGFTPHKRQADLLRLPIWEQMHVMLPWGRQMGKSFSVSAFIAWAIFAFQDVSVYLFSPAEDQTRAILNQVVKFYQRSPFLKRFIHWKPAGEKFCVGGDDWGSFVELVKTGHGGKLGRSTT